MNAPDTKTSRRRLCWKATLLIGSVFVFGMTAGVGGTLYLLVNRVQDNFRQALKEPAQSRGPADWILQRFEKRMVDELGLSEHEMEAVRAELAVTRSQLVEHRKSQVEGVKAIYADTMIRMRESLPEKKRLKFDQLMIRQGEKWGLRPPGALEHSSHKDGK